MRDLQADLFTLFECTVGNILQIPSAVEWTVQGTGMLRCYLDSEKTWRLNVWHKDMIIPDVSLIHDHPWHFDSWILGGEFTNTRFYAHKTKPAYDIDDAIHQYSWSQIMVGIKSSVSDAGGGGLQADGAYWLEPSQVEYMEQGQYYHHEADEIHMTSFGNDGAITINRRVKTDHPEHARVFWPVGKEWVSAKPRLATPD